MKRGFYISPKSWEVVIKSIIEEIIGSTNPGNSNFIKNFSPIKLDKIREIGESAAKKAADSITNFTGKPTDIEIVSVMLITPF